VTTVDEWRAEQRRLLAAAIHLQQSADRIRVLTRMAEAAGLTDYEVPDFLAHAVRDAERACVALGMWSFHRLPTIHHSRRIGKIGERAA
jgi:hypothetical protein